MIPGVVRMGIAVLLPAAAWAQGTATPYPARAPVAAYRMDRAREIALARSAAPSSISGGARILVLGAAGYETAAQGTNGFVCLVERSWANDFGSPDFWNPKDRSPMCLNGAAARSVLPDYLGRTRLALAGAPLDRIKAASAPAAPEVGAMCYMLSKLGYLNDDARGPWRPHLMFFLPRTPAAAWGANADHSPVLVNDPPDAPFTTFLIPVGRWSDGSAYSAP